MGVSSVWEATKRGFDERVPFSVLVTNFYKENGRPIRIAIDAFQWLFEAGSSGTSALPFISFSGKLKQNFHAKIREMISLNVSFILVFDGRFKPNFKRNIDLQKKQNSQLEKKDFNGEYLKFRELGENDELVYVNDMPDILELKKELKRWNISYVDAPAEGEAEASRLQRLGVVDYVLSNDSDTLIFGATKVLRNFSKSEEDRPAGGVGPKPHEYYWCTPVNMDKVKEKTGFDRWRVLLFSILTGADYNNGVKNIGVEKALQLALSSTDFMTRHVATCPYNSFPDYASQLKDIFHIEDGTLPNADLRRLKYGEFQKQMFQHISENILEYFGRNEKNAIKDGYFENFPPDYVVMIYFYPLLRKDVYRFKYGTTNFAETNDASKWLNVPEFNESLRSFKQQPPPNVTNVDIWFTRILSEAYLLRFIIHDLEIPATIEKMKTKEIGTFDLDLFGIRYKYYFPFGELTEYGESDDPELRRLTKTPLKWIPKDLVPTSTQYYKSYIKGEEEKRKKEEERAKTSKKRSPRKKKPTQSSTLISMGFIDAPVKDKSTPLLERRKSSTSQKPPSVSVLDMLKAKKVVKTQFATPLPPPKLAPSKPSLFVSDSDPDSTFEDDPEEEGGLSPIKTVKVSPTKIQSEVKSTIQESPIKVKSRKQGIDTSPSKGNRTYNFLDLEEERSFSTAIKKLDFTKIQNSSTPMKRIPIDDRRKSESPGNVSIITIDDTSMIEDSSIMEISHISGKKHESEMEVEEDVAGNVRDETQLKETKTFSALDDILQPLQYSSDDGSDDGEQ